MIPPHTNPQGTAGSEQHARQPPLREALSAWHKKGSRKYSKDEGNAWCNGWIEGYEAARDQFADELKKDLQSRIVSQSNQWCKGRNSGLIECCNVIDESLRHQQEPQQ